MERKLKYCNLFTRKYQWCQLSMLVWYIPSSLVLCCNFLVGMWKFSICFTDFRLSNFWGFMKIIVGTLPRLLFVHIRSHQASEHRCLVTYICTIFSKHYVDNLNCIFTETVHTLRAAWFTAIDDIIRQAAGLFHWHWKVYNLTTQCMFSQRIRNHNSRCPPSPDSSHGMSDFYRKINLSIYVSCSSIICVTHSTFPTMFIIRFWSRWSLCLWEDIIWLTSEVLKNFI